jgi:integrase
VPRARSANATTLSDLVSQFLRSKRVLLESGDLEPSTYNSDARICNELLQAFGPNRLLTDILPKDFQDLRAAWAKRWTTVTLGNGINRARGVFNFAWKARLIAAPIFYGAEFQRPSRKKHRLHRAAKGQRFFEAADLRSMIGGATQPLKTMLLLGINCAFGNADCARLPISALDLERGWITYPRGKTGIERRCPLWPETIEAVKEWLAVRPTPKDTANFTLLFVTVRGNQWDAGTDNRAITHECRKLIDRLGITGHGSFYRLRHVFESIGGESRDQVAVDALMGHANDDMASVYRERISDERLRAVADVVRAWLFTPAKEEKPVLKVAEEGEAASA